MFKEIVDLYKKQYHLYEKVLDILKKIENPEFDLSQYNIELENVDYLLDSIKLINERAEQLKIIYITKNNLSDFTGKEIRNTVNPEEYDEFKMLIDKLSNIIVSVKKLHDSIIFRIKNEMNTTNQLLGTLGKGLNIGEIYKKQTILDKSKYFDKKK